MCEYCNTKKKSHLNVVCGKDMSETDGGTMQIEKLSNYYYISSICFDGDVTESNIINYCPMCGRKLGE